MKNKVFANTVSILLLVITIIFLLSGMALSKYWWILRTITFGLLEKSLFYEIHAYLWIPFVGLLILHLIASISNQKKSKE
jgi:hypothetical protein